MTNDPILNPSILYPQEKPATFGRISRNLKYGLVYEGKVKDSDQTFDASESVNRWDQVNKLSKEQTNIKRIPTKIEVYGKTITHNLPMRHTPDDQPNQTLPESDTVITPEVYAYIVQRAKRKMISDNVL